MRSWWTASLLLAAACGGAATTNGGGEARDLAGGVVVADGSVAPDGAVTPADGAVATDLGASDLAPSVASNPPVPAGWKLMTQSEVTPAMTMWAVAILHDPVTYPMFSTTTRTFGTLTVLARVEWHPPDFQNGAVHRGVTLYVPA